MSLERELLIDFMLRSCSTSAAVLCEGFRSVRRMNAFGSVYVLNRVSSADLCLRTHSQADTDAKEPGWLIDIALGYGLDDRGFESPQGLGIFLFTAASRPAMGPTQPPIQWVPGALSLGLKLPGREADNSPRSSAEATEWV
jgi:hypothetical protein